MANAIGANADVRSNSCLDKTIQTLFFVKDKAVDFYNEASVSGETQKKCLALLRTTVAIAAIDNFPVYALIGGSLAAISPSYSQTVVNAAEGAISGLWHSMSFKARVVAVTVSVPAVAYGYSALVISAFGAVLATKLGAEYTVRNYSKQNVDEATKKAEAEQEALNSPQAIPDINGARRRSSTMTGESKYTPGYGLSNINSVST